MVHDLNATLAALPQAELAGQQPRCPPASPPRPSSERSAGSIREPREQPGSDLKAEQQHGQHLRAETDNQQVGLRSTLLLISPAIHIQVLEDLLAAAKPQAADGLTGTRSAPPATAAAAGSPTGPQP